MSKILFLNRLFGPDTEATGVLLSELAEDLTSNNSITVICGRTDTSQHKVWPLIQRESHGAVKLVRVFALKISKEHAMLRHLGPLVYFVIAAIVACRERADVIVTETDPPTLGLLGVILSLRRSCRFVYYCQDVYPDVAEATGALKNRALLGLLRFFNKLALSRADAIVALAADMAGLLRFKGVPADKIAIIPNWIDCEKVKPQAPEAAWREKYSSNFVVMYAGNLGWTQDLQSVLEAARLLLRDARVKFVLVGDGARKKHLEDEAKVKGLTNVDFIDHVKPSAMSEVLAVAQLHLIPLGAGVAGCMVPSKVYGILAAGRPFVAMMEKHAEVARLAAESEVGFVIPPGDAAALAQTITDSIGAPKLLEGMGRRARALAEQTYDRRLVTARFAEFLAAILAGKPPRSSGVKNEVIPSPRAETPATISAE
jgi:colanic acid biosynthesis glycosyl transferase WcaI